MPFKVEKKKNESQEQLLRRFKKKTAKSKIMSEVRRRRWHISKSELRRMEKKKAIRRMRKNRRSKNYR